MIISAGSNDQGNRKLAEQLLFLRQKVSATRVVWLLPYRRDTAQQVNTVAKNFGDMTVDLKHFASQDGVHPSYAQVTQYLLKQQ